MQRSVTDRCDVVTVISIFFVNMYGDVIYFFTAIYYIIPSFIIFIAVTGWVVYTMGGEHFAGWSALRYSTLSCLLGTVTASLVVMLVTVSGYISVPTIENIKIVSPHILFMIIFPGVKIGRASCRE